MNCLCTQSEEFHNDNLIDEKEHRELASFSEIYFNVKGYNYTFKADYEIGDLRNPHKDTRFVELTCENSSQDTQKQ